MEKDFHPVANIFPLLDGQGFTDLVDDIKANGLHEDIWCHKDGRIIDGRNRYRACKAAGVSPRFRSWHGAETELVAFVVSLNLHRRHLSESQRAMVAANIANLEHGGDRSKPSIDGLPAEKAAEMLNVGRASVERARTVHRHGVPELADQVVSGKASVSAAAEVATLPHEQQREVVAKGEKEILRKAKEIREEKARENARSRAEVASRQIELPDGRYSTIVIDPPWPMQKIARDVRPDQVGFDYPTMSIDAIKAFDVGSMAADDCHLYVWTTQRFLPDTFDIMSAWGFKYIFTMVWHKPGGPQPFGLPQYNCEFILFGRRGGLPFLDTKAFPTCFNAPRREHSRKPDEFYDVVQRVSPGPRIDIFSREMRDGFDQFGNEAGKYDMASR